MMGRLERPIGRFAKQSSRLSRARCAVLVAVVGVLGAATAWVQEGAPQGLDLEFPPHGTIRWDRGEAPATEVRPLPGDGWISLARRYLGDPSGAADLREVNRGLRSPVRDRPVRLPRPSAIPSMAAPL